MSRKFVSIQTAVVESTVTLIAVADDGTAWSRRGYIGNSWLPADEDEPWVQVPNLPKIEPRKIPTMVLKD